MRKSAILIEDITMQASDFSQPPTLAFSVPTTFHEAVGKLIVAWGMMERELNILLWALLKHNGTVEPGWRERPFGKRYGLLQSEWEIFASGFPDLQKLIETAYGYIQKCKVLRDSIAHKEMTMGLCTDEGSHFIQFYNKTRTKQKSKPYYVADFNSASDAASHAAGFFRWLTQPEAIWPLSSHDTSRLRSLPNTDRLRIAT